MKLQKWTAVFPQGTKEGDDEHAFFVALSRNPKLIWHSTSGLANSSGLTKEKVESIIKKYLQMGLVYQHPKNDDNWGYWERMPEELLPKDRESLVEKDHKARMKKQS